MDNISRDHNRCYSEVRAQAVALSDRLATLSVRRWRSEVELLSTVAPIGRWGIALAEREGITVDAIADDDTRSIWLTPKFCDERNIFDPIRCATLCRSALRLVERWDDHDPRGFVAGDRWGPGAIAAIFHRVSKRDAEESVPRLAATVLALARQYEQLSVESERVRIARKAEAA
jgi:hypothetical protein